MSDERTFAEVMREINKNKKKAKYDKKVGANKCVQTIAKTTKKAKKK